MAAGLLDQRVTAHDAKDLGVEVLGHPNRFDRQQSSESPGSAGVSDDFGACRGVDHDRRHGPVSTRSILSASAAPMLSKSGSGPVSRPSSIVRNASASSPHRDLSRRRSGR